MNAITPGPKAINVETCAMVWLNAVTWEESHTGAITISTGFPVPVNSAVEFQYSIYSF